MEFREIKVAILSKEDKLLFKEVSKYAHEAELAQAKVQLTYSLFWQRLREEHQFFGSGHFIKGNSIYKYELG